jgi:hypothetical protein
LTAVNVRGSGPLVVSSRVDWRFLLPAFPGGRPASLVVRGGDATTVAALEAAGIAERVSEAWPPAQPADLIALLHGARETLADAAARLAPGGILYCEVTRPRRDAILSPVRDLYVSRGFQVGTCQIGGRSLYGMLHFR